MAEHTNALANETSPYLLQHADNPVYWMPWKPAALEKARRENKQIFLSIGYAACHWCHVMEHESFEDAEIAAILNEHFVSIKVDREERPDLDEIYMTATMVFTGGHGGWPMSVFLSPDLKPVYAGTYFPKDNAYGRPGFRTILQFLAQRWQENPQSLTADSEKVVGVIRRMHGGPDDQGPALSAEQLRGAAERVYEAFDLTRGGVPSGSNKFPPSAAIDLLLRTWRRTGSRRLLEVVELTLERMANGGIYDHLGGGIHRYSTDPNWLVPHFEKMLYDQGLVACAYVYGWQATEQPELKKLFAARVRGICDYVVRDLGSPEGPFYSSEDADSEGLEGKFYIWTRDEIFGVVGDEQAAQFFCSHYDVSEQGNWAHPGDSHVPKGPKNILQVVRPVETIAKVEDVSADQVREGIAAASQELFAARERRVRPGLDDKILSGWNGLMITALARAAAALDEAEYAAAAGRAADFVLDKMRSDGRLFASYGKGEPRLAAYSTDYAFLIEGLLALYEATGDFARLEQAAELTDTLVEHYWDDEGGGFYFTADDHEELLVRSKTAHDGATPSSNSVMVGNLLKLGVALDREDLRKKAAAITRAFGVEAAQQPFQSERLLAEIDALLEGLVEIVIVGEQGTAPAKALVDRVWSVYLPGKVVALLAPDGDAPDLPLFAGRTLVDGQPAAYVCRDFVCQRPVTDPDKLSAQLRDSVARAGAR